MIVISDGLIGKPSTSATHPSLAHLSLPLLCHREGADMPIRFT
jgi:hypothetical protein